ncbi:hypothetical protein R5O87_17015 [Arthrobacter globiformis]|uniref:hypothetical protein n=1 Tax=Arthrobacter globiformis TaxID=1665 RepID=UPI0039793CC5
MRCVSLVLPASALSMIAVVWPALLGKLTPEIGTRVSESGVDHIQLAPHRPSGDIVLLTGLDGGRTLDSVPSTAPTRSMETDARVVPRARPSSPVNSFH